MKNKFYDYHNRTIVHDNNSIAIYDRVQTMRYREDGAIFEIRSNCFLNQFVSAVRSKLSVILVCGFVSEFLPGIYIGSSLVEHEDAIVS